MKKPWRIDIGSWSTFGQMALLLLAALLVAQVLAFLLFRTVLEQWQSTAVVEPAVNRFADVALQTSGMTGEARVQFLSIVGGGDQRYALGDDPGFPDSPQSATLEQSLKETLEKRGVKFTAVRALLHGAFGGPPFMPDDRPRPGDRPPPPDMRGAPDMRGVPGMPPPGRDPGFRLFPFHPEGPGGRHEVVLLAARFADGAWLTGRFTTLKPLPLLLNPITVSEIALFAVLLGISLFWASRISKPLRILARAAEDLRPQHGFSPLPEKGPRDVRTAIVSFNAMAARVRDLVQEKDRMLSAIGHDLRTPLASLRLHAESVEPAAERDRIVETVDEMTGMVDEILSLARLGHSTEDRLMVDLAALADTVVEDYRSLGKDVTFLESPRTPLLMQQSLVRRLLRNLIDNAVKYGERARVFVTRSPEAVRLFVEDDGPGIPPEALTEVIQPFTRLERSRSRETGGMGLGLSIADAIARGQGAVLKLENPAEGGLRAAVIWPAAPATVADSAKE